MQSQFYGTRRDLNEPRSHLNLTRSHLNENLRDVYYQRSGLYASRTTKNQMRTTQTRSRTIETRSRITENQFKIPLFNQQTEISQILGTKLIAFRRSKMIEHYRNYDICDNVSENNNK